MANQEYGVIFGGRCFLPGVRCRRAEKELAKLRYALYMSDLEFELLENIVEKRESLAYDDGYDEGREEGYEDGYDNGYHDGSYEDDEDDEDAASADNGDNESDS